MLSELTLIPYEEVFSNGQLPLAIAVGFVFGAMLALVPVFVSWCRYMISGGEH